MREREGLAFFVTFSHNRTSRSHRSALLLRPRLSSPRGHACNPLAGVPLPTTEGGAFSSTFPSSAASLAFSLGSGALLNWTTRGYGDAFVAQVSEEKETPQRKVDKRFCAVAPALVCSSC